MSTDDLDRPEEDGYALAVPFVVCTSNGGPYDDDAFVAGFQAGTVDQSLKSIAAAGGDGAVFTVRTDLVKQLELLAMYRGFPKIEATEIDEEWSTIEFRTGGTP